MDRWNLRFRQVHLDFHTSEQIPGIGEKFDKKQWQEALRLGHVDSITCFSKCHHGWSYHPTKVGRIHPNLGFDLLRAQYDACKEIDVNVPVYLSAGVDYIVGKDNPQWREMSIEGAFMGWSGAMNKPGFISMCFNTGYLDYLCDQIREAVTLFPQCDGIFLDIIAQGECCCPACMKYMDENGLDAEKQEDRRKCADEALLRYYRDTTAAAKCLRSDMPIFHNSGHISRNKTDLLRYFSHLEMESLPTGGWGYDHFPMSAKFAQHLGMDYLGMTGKFHTTWGEFGGYKHPNALRYECAAMLAQGSKCSIGDQLHPNGEADESTYSIIGAAYAEVEKKEPWCVDAKGVVDVAVLSSEAEGFGSEAETGAGRVLLEGHILFDLIDRKVPFGQYKLLILPDVIAVDEDLKAKLEAYLAAGGKLLLTGKSGLRPDVGSLQVRRPGGMSDVGGQEGFAIDIGADYFGESEFLPDFVDAGESLAPSFTASPVVMYRRSQRVKATTGEALAQVQDPYFNRTWRHFCSHQHAPASGQSGYAAAVRKGNVLYLAHPIFTIYKAIGAVANREYAVNAIRQLLGDDVTVTTNMPSTARVTLTDQPQHNRYILHLLYANTISRGSAPGPQIGQGSSDGYCVNPEVIEELLPLHDVEVSLKLPRAVQSVTLEPQGESIPFERDGDTIKIRLDKFTCHQMVALAYGL